MYISDQIKQLINKDLSKSIAVTIIIISMVIFLFLQYPVSNREIRNHDHNLSIMLSEIKTFKPDNAGIFVEPYIFYGFRHIMYYLPEYRVYLVDVRIAPTGEKMKTFWGINRRTFLSDSVVLPASINNFIIPTFSDIRDKVKKVKGTSIKSLATGIYIASGPSVLIQIIFPESKFQFQRNINNYE